MRRRDFTAFLGGAAAAWPFAVHGQQSGKVARIGYLSLEVNAPFAKAFERGLETLGYVPGRNVVIEYRWAQGVPERLHELAAELVRLRVDVIVAPTGQATLAAAKATATIPIVFVTVPGPVELGFVVSLARPGKNITGLSVDSAPGLVAKPLELLKEIAPTTSRVAMFRYRGIGEAERAYEEIHRTAGTLKLAIETYETHALHDVERAFPLIMRQRPDWLFLPPSPLTFARRKEIADFALREQLPVAGGLPEYAQDGGLFAYGTDLKDQYRRTATFVDKILKGARPAELPVEQPAKFDLVVNLKTAKALGITIPTSLLARADEVIE